MGLATLRILDYKREKLKEINRRGRRERRDDMIIDNYLTNILGVLSVRSPKDCELCGKN